MRLLTSLPLPGTRPNTGRGLIVALLIGVSSVRCFSAGYQPWGIYLSEPTPVASLPDLTETALVANRQLEATRAQIVDLEAREGPYSPKLTPLLVAAAEEAAEYGVADSALELYRWALHSTRINEGLASERQLPLLRAMMELLRQQGDAQQVAQRSDYFYRLLGRGGEPWDDQRLGASVAWLAVHAELLSNGPWRGREGDAVFVIDHGLDLADDVCEDELWRADWCVPLTLEAIKLLYLLDYRIDPLVVDQFGVAQDRFAQPFDDGLEQSPAERQLRSIERTARSRGRALLARARELAPDDAGLKLASADWYWFHDRRRQAIELYAELQDELGVDFSAPQPLPSTPRIQRDPRLASEWADLQITGRISARGRFEAIDVGGEQAADFRGFVRRQLREVRCRPALDAAGEPIETPFTWSVRALR